MKSRIVFVIAMLVLVGILLAAVSFGVSVMDEYQGIVKEENKQNDEEEEPPVYEPEDPEEPPVYEPEDPEEPPAYEPEDPEEVTPELDGYFSEAKKGAHTGGYRWVKTDQYEAWQPITGDGSNATTTLFRYGGDGYWLIEDTNPGWVSDPVVTFSYDDSPRMEFANVNFYYQVCRNGIWEDELHPMDGSLFSAYICKVNLYSELNDFSIHKVVKVESGYYQFVLDGRYKAYVCVGLESAWDPTITAVNFHMDYYY